MLWREGLDLPKLMSVGLHGRISGHPARAIAVARFLDYVQSHDAVWICRREDVARHWIAEHPLLPQ
jgi:peptidoglycan/xylan/chitin deacetylase (PgdA/CDA1 family)